MASFRVITAEPDLPAGIATSSAIDKLEEAISFARDLTRGGVTVLRIEDASGAVVRDGRQVIEGETS